MAEAIRMPLLSDTMKEGIIAEWHKKVGDTVKSDDVIAEVETDKATMEVMPYVDGTLLYIGVEKGKGVPVNGIMAIVGKPGEDYRAILNAEGIATGAPAPQPAAAKNDWPDVQSIFTTASSVPVHEAAQALPPAPDATPAHASAINVPVLQFDTPFSNDSTVEQVADAGEANDRLKASPLAKRLAHEKGLDLQQVKGSGDYGRIIKRDVDNYVAPAVPVAAVANVTPAPAARPQPVLPAPPVAAVAAPMSADAGYTDTPLSQMRRIIAQKLTESKNTAPHFYLRMTVTMDKAMEARKAINNVSPVKVSFNDLVIKACAMALRKHPAVNSSWMGDFIRQNNNINIGTAVAVPEGLIVPVVRNADLKSLSQIATEAGALIEKARSKKITPQEFTGNTFTISNLGMMDIDEFTAIINPPDSCILAVGKIAPTPVVEDGAIVVRNLMKLTLSCDHRAVDGAVGASFLQTLKVLLENPVTMLA